MLDRVQRYSSSTHRAQLVTKENLDNWNDHTRESTICDICEPLPNDIENFGVDSGGPLPLHDSVDVPFTSKTLTNEQLQELKSIVSGHATDDDVGIDAY